MYILTLEKVDSSGSEQLKYVYQIGEHILGRGPELQCTSKKVSRKHALLKVTQNDGVLLESTHNNPCYHQSKNTQSIQIVSFSKSIKVNHEDKISLALEHGWFRANISKDNKEEPPSDIIKNKRELDNDEASEAKKIKLNDINNTTELNANETNIMEAEEAPKNDEAEGTINNEPLNTEDNTTNIELKQEPLDESTNEPEIKQEPADTSAEVAVKDEPEDDPNNTDKQDKCTNDPTAASTSLGNGSSRRDRCWYGSSCYRKNPTHRATFSHPNDTDYDSDPNDNRAICCYGVNCYRRNKLHREKYRHPGQDRIPDPPSKNKKRKQPKSPKTDKTRTRKAKTNTVDYYDDDEENDYDLDDPFINDGDSSDEYEPETSDTESDDEASSQSQNTEEQEDTKQLLKDARKFARRN